MTLRQRVVALVLCLQLVVLIPVLIVAERRARQDVTRQTVADGELIANLLVHAAIFSQHIPEQVETIVGDQMVVQATIASHLLAVAESAGLTRDQIWNHFEAIMTHSKIASLVAADSTGFCYLNFPGSRFYFSPDPKIEPEASAFWGLLTGEKQAVIGKAQARDSDGRYMKYVGVPGQGKPRIVEVGMDAQYLRDLKAQVGVQRLLDELQPSHRILALQVTDNDA